MEDTAHEASALPKDISLGEGAAYEYWKLWRHGQRPNLGDFVAHLGPTTPADLAAILRVDQRERWSRADRVPAEQYLELFPLLGQSVEDAIALVYAEFLLRRELGETPSSQEYQ